MYFNEINILD